MPPKTDLQHTLRRPLGGSDLYRMGILLKPECGRLVL